MKIIIPEQFRKLIGSPDVDGQGKTVGEVLDNLVKEFPDLKPRLFTDNNEINRFVNVYVNDEDIRFLNGLLTELKNEDIVTLLPSITGG